jgi:hypothetical protein
MGQNTCTFEDFFCTGLILCLQLYTDINICVWMHKYMCLNVSIFIFMKVYVCIWMYVCMYVYIGELGLGLGLYIHI